MIARWAGAVVALCALVVSCDPPSAGEGEGEGEGEEVPFEGATPEDLVAAGERYLDRCGPKVFGFFAEQEPTYFSYALDMLRPTFRETLLAKLTTERAVFDPFAAARCIKQLDILNVSACTTEVLSVSEVCASVLTGIVPLVGACAYDEECADGLACLFTDDVGCGSCSFLREEGEGPCEQLADCVAGLVCVDGLCRSLLKEGDPCSACHPPLYCDRTTLTCQPIVLASVGEPCNSAAAYCVDQATTTTCRLHPKTGALDICVPLPKVGDDCLSGSIFRCDATDSICDFDLGICVDAGELGDACTDPTECQLGFDCDFDSLTCESTRFEATIPICGD